MRRFLELLCWLLPPSRLKNATLRRFGHVIAETASIGPILVMGVARFEVADHARIWPFNAFKDLNLVRLDEHAMVNAWNWISAAVEFQDVDPEAGTLDMGYGAGVGSRNYLDCSGTIIIRPYGWIGGNRVFVQTHGPDFEEDRQSAGRVVIGHHALAASRSVLLKGAHVPDQSILGANSTMLGPNPDGQRPGLYVGAPARWRTGLRGEWFNRTTHVMAADVIEGPMGPESYDRAAVEPVD